MVWNFRQSARAYRFLGHKEAINDVEFSSTGQIIATASSDKTVRLWIPSVKGESTPFKAHTAAVRGINFSDDCSQIITCR